MGISLNAAPVRDKSLRTSELRTTSGLENTMFKKPFADLKTSGKYMSITVSLWC